MTVGVNVLVGLCMLTGWIDRPHPCAPGCWWRPAGGVLWVVLAILDVGVLLIWAGIGYMRLMAVGERIGHRISGRQDGESDDP